MEVLGVGYQEILLVAVLIVIVVGPRRMPEMAYYLGRGVKKLQRYARVVRDEFSEEFTYLNDEMEAVRSDMQEVQISVRQVREELAEVKGEVEEVGSEAAGELGEVRSSIEEHSSGLITDSQAPKEVANSHHEVPGGGSNTDSVVSADVNGDEPPRGVPGPTHMPVVSTSEAKRVASSSEPGKEAIEEVEDETKPEKPLVF